MGNVYARLSSAAGYKIVHGAAAVGITSSWPACLRRSARPTDKQPSGWVIGVTNASPLPFTPTSYPICAG